MNIVRLIKAATAAGEEWSRGKNERDIEEMAESAARNSYMLWLSAAQVSTTNEEDWQHWRGYFGVACLR